MLLKPCQLRYHNMKIVLSTLVKMPLYLVEVESADDVRLIA